MKLLKWTAVAAMFVIGFGAVYVSTVGLSETQAATTDYLTQAASRADIARTSAATGTVAPSESYALAFGEDARIAATTTTAAAESSWLVDSSPVAIGDRVTAGQTLATASTADIDDQIERATQSLMLAQMTLAEADKTLKSARTDTRQQLTDAHTAVDAAQLGLKSAKVQRSEADTDNPKRSAKIAVIRAQDSLRAAKRLRDDLKAQLDGNFPDQTIAVGQAQESVADLEGQLADLTAA